MAPLKNKNKISIKQVKGLQKNFLQHFFFFFGCLFLFRYCLGRYWSIYEKQISKRLIWAYNIAMLLSCVLRPKHFSLDTANFSLFSQEGEVTSPLIPGPAWTLRLQFTKYQQSCAPMKIFYFFFFYSTYSLYPEHCSTGASLCAASYYLPRAYNAPLGGALVNLVMLNKLRSHAHF